MIQAALSVLLLASPIQDDGEGARLTTRNLEVDGWYCDRDDCSPTSQAGDQTVRFDQARSRLGLSKADTLPEDWTVVMRCSVARGRLSQCLVESDTSTSAKASPIARRLAEGLRVSPAARVGAGVGTRAVLSIMYSPGECGWQCIPASVPPAASVR